MPAKRRSLLRLFIGVHAVYQFAVMLLILFLGHRWFSCVEKPIDICERERVDVVLLDVMMAGMDGFEACRRLKNAQATAHIPVIMVTALDQPSDKVQGLQAGADDFLTKPVDDIALITRVKNLARLKMLNDEMAMRASTSKQMGLGPNAMAKALRGETGRILLVDDHPRSGVRIHQALAKTHDTTIERDIQSGLAAAMAACYVLVMVWPFARDYFELDLPTADAWVAVAIAAAIGAIGIAFATKVFTDD